MCKLVAARKERMRESCGRTSSSESHVDFNHLNAITPPGACTIGGSSLNTFLGISINISPNSAIRDTFLRRYNYICRLPLAEVQNSIRRKLSLPTPVVSSPGMLRSE